MSAEAGPPPMPEPNPDHDLVEEARAGSRAAFSTLVRRYQGALRSYIARYVRQPEIADDIAQEVFLNAYQRLASFQSQGTFRQWLFGIGRRRLIDHYRASRRTDRAATAADRLADGVAGWLLDRVEADEGRLAAEERRLDALRACLARLPDQSAKLVASYYYESHTAAEVGSTLGKSEDAVRMTIMRIRRALQKCVSERLRVEAEAT